MTYLLDRYLVAVGNYAKKALGDANMI